MRLQVQGGPGVDVSMIPRLDDGMRRPDVLPLLALTVALGLTVVSGRFEGHFRRGRGATVTPAR